MKGKKTLAILAAAALAFAGPAGSAQAATFRSVNQASLEEIKEYILTTPQTEPSAGSQSGLNLKLEDAGRAIAGMMVPLDLSWLDNAEITAKASTEGDITHSVIAASLNGVNLLNINVQVDISTMEMTVYIPELSGAVLTMNLADSMDTSASLQVGSDYETNTALTPEQQRDLIRAGRNLQENPPAPEVIASLVERYCTILFDAYEEGEAGTDTVSVEGHTIDTETVEGILTQDGAMAMAKELFQAARDDAELKAILEQAAVGTSAEDTIYESFQQGIDSILKELNEPVETADEAAETAGEAVEGTEPEAAADLAAEADAPTDTTIKYWLDDQEKAVGIQVSTTGAAGSKPFVKIMNPCGEDWSALSLDIYADEAPLSLTGSGQIADGTLTGQYVLSMAGQALADIQAVQSADTKETRVFDGEYVITPITDPEDETNPMNSLNGFGLAAAIHGAKGDGSLKLDIQSSGASLINATLYSKDSQETVAVEIPEGAEAFDMTDEEGMNNYMATFDVTNVIMNLFEAGMPEDFFDQINAMSSGSSGYSEGEVTGGDYAGGEMTDDYAEDALPAETEDSPAA